MESPKSVVSPLKTSVFSGPETRNLDLFAKNPNFASKKTDPFLGVLEVYIHQARDIQNICIYHKQDVYAKICLTSNPEISVTTQTINGGGQNPVFNENLWIDITNIESSIKCEIYMLSRVRNYLEDQLLGFALIPLSEVFVKNGKLEKEFTLSSNDLFHSPSGFVQLSLSYNGVLPEIGMSSLPPPPSPVSDECDFDKIEFPDPKIANENEIMVSEYCGLSSESSGDQAGSETDEPFGSETGASVGSETRKSESSVSTNGSLCTESGSKTTDEELGSVRANEPVEDGSIGSSTNKPLAVVDIEAELKVVQQDFVDLYMKSMQQFTESLAKKKLPLAMETEPTGSENSSSGQTTQTQDGARPRVFYGSRAFF